jgi:heme O synthase-like polyprenyltransferase
VAVGAAKIMLMLYDVGLFLVVGPVAGGLIAAAAAAFWLLRGRDLDAEPVRTPRRP